VNARGQVYLSECRHQVAASISRSRHQLTIPRPPARLSNVEEGHDEDGAREDGAEWLGEDNAANSTHDPPDENVVEGDLDPTTFHAAGAATVAAGDDIDENRGDGEDTDGTMDVDMAAAVDVVDDVVEECAVTAPGTVSLDELQKAHKSRESSVIQERLVQLVRDNVHLLDNSEAGYPMLCLNDKTHGEAIGFDNLLCRAFRKVIKFSFRPATQWAQEVVRYGPFGKGMPPDFKRVQKLDIKE
jgi:hypothetical protein